MKSTTRVPSFGNNDEYPGGMVRSQVHVDGGAREATVEVDGRKILDRASCSFDCAVPDGVH
jgi:hypothetical protein